jgi:hypothetical protein
MTTAGDVQAGLQRLRIQKSNREMNLKWQVL